MNKEVEHFGFCTFLIILFSIAVFIGTANTSYSTTIGDQTTTNNTTAVTAVGWALGISTALECVAYIYFIVYKRDNTK
jgi:purine-cytosine permease-like protein